MALLEESGKIYTFGWEENGRLGYSKKDIPSTKPNSLEPRLVTPQLNEDGIKEDFIQVVWGYHFTLAISSTNWLYSWGRGDSGIHCDDLFLDKWTLSKIDSITDKVIFVSAGNDHWGYIDSQCRL